VSSTEEVVFLLWNDRLVFESDFCEYHGDGRTLYIAKAEHSVQGANQRFVVTNVSGGPQSSTQAITTTCLYDPYDRLSGLLLRLNGRWCWPTVPVKYRRPSQRRRSRSAPVSRTNAIFPFTSNGSSASRPGQFRISARIGSKNASSGKNSDAESVSMLVKQDTYRRDRVAIKRLNKKGVCRELFEFIERPKAERRQRRLDGERSRGQGQAYKWASYWAAGSVP